MFDAGVASGDPTTTSVVLWTRAVPATGPLRWLVGRRGESTVLASGEVTAGPDADGTVRVEATALPPGTSLWFRFQDPTGSSCAGTTATLPADPERFTIGVACCADWTAGPFDAYRWLAERRPDLVLHIGDYVYEHGHRGPYRRHDPPRKCATLTDHRRRYRQYRTDPDLLALHGAAPWISLWDDHEFRTSAWQPGRHRRPAGVETAARVDAAIRANLEWLPRRAGTSTSPSLDRHRRLGDLLDLIVVDCRLGRERPVDDEDGPTLAPGDDDQARMLAPRQWRWLESVLDRPAPRWTVLVSSVQVSPLRLGYLPWLRRGRPGVRPLINPDQWDGYPADRQRLLDLLGPRAGSVLLLSGDLHGRFWTGVPGDGFHLPELTVPSVSAPSFVRLVRRRLPLPRAALDRVLRWCNPHLADLDLVHHGAALLVVEPDGITVSVGPDAPVTRRLTGQQWDR